MSSLTSDPNATPCTTNNVRQSDQLSITLRALGCFWGVAGFIALIIYAIVRLGLVSLEALQLQLTALQWSLLIFNMLFMAYSEGYKGFQRGYAPRLAARAKYLLRNGSKQQLLLAPLFCMSFFDAPRKRMVTSYALLVMIICLVSLFRLLPQPWRGILDAGVVIGLSWGLLSTLYFLYLEFFTDKPYSDPELD